MQDHLSLTIQRKQMWLCLYHFENNTINDRDRVVRDAKRVDTCCKDWRHEWSHTATKEGDHMLESQLNRDGKIIDIV